MPHAVPARRDALPANPGLRSIGSSTNGYYSCDKSLIIFQVHPEVVTVHDGVPEGRSDGQAGPEVDAVAIDARLRQHTSDSTEETTCNAPAIPLDSLPTFTDPFRRCGTAMCIQ